MIAATTSDDMSGDCESMQDRSATRHETLPARSASVTNLKVAAAAVGGVSAFDARRYSFTGLSLPKPAYWRSEFSVATMLELIRPGSKGLLWSTTVTGRQGGSPVDIVASVPASANRTGKILSSTIFDPLSQTPFPLNTVPQSRIDKRAAEVIRQIPFANRVGSIHNFEKLTVNSMKSHAVETMLEFSDGVMRGVRIGGNIRSSVGDALRGYTYRDTELTSGWAAQVRYSRAILPNLGNEFELRVARSRLENRPELTGSNLYPPNLRFTSVFDVADLGSSWRQDDRWQLKNSVERIDGHRKLTAGIVTARTLLTATSDGAPRGELTFTGLLTSALTPSGTPLPGTGSDLADLLLGLPQSAWLEFAHSKALLRNVELISFIQSEWRRRGGLVLTIGLRHEYVAPFDEASGRLANIYIDPTTHVLRVITPKGSASRSMAQLASYRFADWNNFAPSAGIGWRLNRRLPLVLRTSFSVSYDTASSTPSFLRLPNQAPFGTSVALQSSPAVRLSMYPAFLQNALPQGRVSNTFGMPLHFPAATIYTLQVGLQWQWRDMATLGLSYQGIHGSNLVVHRFPNQALPGNVLTAEDRRPFREATGFVMASPTGRSQLGSVELRVAARPSNQVSLLGSYRYAKSCDDIPEPTLREYRVAQNDRDWRAEMAYSSLDRRHIANITTSYTLVQSRRPAIGMWNAALIVDTISGSPATARVGGNRSDVGGSGSLGTGRADGPGDASLAVSHTRFADSYTLPAPNSYGSLQRNTLRLPMIFEVSASIGPTWTVGARYLTLSIEATNIVNRATPDAFGLVINAPNFGIPYSARPMRSVVFRLRWGG